MTDTRSSSAMFKRAEQLKRWEESDTNKHSASPKPASRIKFSPSVVFLSACTSGEKKEVQRLLKLGADINTANSDGLTALHQLCIDDNLEMVEFLVARGADVNRGDNEGWTPLHVTASCGHISIARYLIDNGADVAAVNCDGHLPIDISESADMEKMLQKVIDEKGIDCEKSRNAEVDYLMREVRNWAVNGYVDLHDPKTGGTPLHVAAAKGYLEVLKILLEECNVELDCVDNDGWTPLHAAALWGQKEAATMLLQHGADPNVKNYLNQTCLDVVDPSNSTWLAEAIQSRRVNNKNKRKARPPRHDTIKRDKSLSTPNENTFINNKTTPNPETVHKAPEGKPPKGRPPSPEVAEEASKNVSSEDALAWRRLSYRMAKQPEKEFNSVVHNEPDSDTILRRTRSFETDKNFYERYRDVTARIRASSCPSITPLSLQPPDSPTPAPAQPKTNNASENTNEDVQARINPLQKNDSLPDTTAVQSKARSWSFVPPVRDEESETQRKAHAKRVRETRRSTQGVTLDELKSAEQFVKKKTAGNGKKTDDDAETDAFELEDEDRRPSPPRSADAVVTLMLRRPPAGSDANTASPPTATEEKRTGDEEKDNENNKLSSNPASAQAALSAVQRRRRPKRRSTGVGHVDMDDIVNDRGRGGDGDADTESVQSGSERTSEVEERDYKALYEASEREVRRLRALLANSEMQLSDARTAITTLTQMNQNSSSELNNREKRAIERKLSEMEEELKFQQALQVENQRLKDENGALIRVISKLSK